MIIKDVSGIIRYNRILQSLKNHEYAIIMDKFDDGFSLIGIPDHNDAYDWRIATDSIETFDQLLSSQPLFNKSNTYSGRMTVPGPGWYGYFSYDLKNKLFRQTIRKQAPRYPLIHFFYLPAVFKIFHRSRKIQCICRDESAFSTALSALETGKAESNKDFSLELDYLCPYSQYKPRIERIRQEIIDGNVYQVNFAHRIKFKFTGHPLDCYLTLRKKARPAHGAYFRAKDFHILSFSPERFFKIENGIIESCPIKGTMPRSSKKELDDYYKKQLKQSTKDKAEHLMIVDLIRNDLGKICRTGSVKVSNLFKIESFKTVHHMVSTVSGFLNQNITIANIIEAIFPGGSITGAPKIAAMHYIDELEDFNREIYTGNIGYICNNSMDFNIAIRTLVINNVDAFYAVGGGIVYDSDPLKEYQETLTKSRILGLRLK